ncbi:MAG: hypothetical protein ACF8PN_12955 [Phycisphaerales bacterium]
MLSRVARRGNSLIGLALLILVIGVVVIFLMQSPMSPTAVNAHVDEYMALFDDTDRNNPTGGSPLPPAVVVDYEMSRIDDLHGRMTPGRRAEKHDEVGSIIVLIRTSTGMPGATAPGLAVASANKGMYSIAAFIMHTDGTLLRSTSVRKESAISGAGAEGEIRPQVEQEILAWIGEQYE